MVTLITPWSGSGKKFTPLFMTPLVGCPTSRPPAIWAKWPNTSAQDAVFSPISSATGPCQRAGTGAEAGGAESTLRTLAGEAIWPFRAAYSQLVCGLPL